MGKIIGYIRETNDKKPLIFKQREAIINYRSKSNLPTIIYEESFISL